MGRQAPVCLGKPHTSPTRSITPHSPLFVLLPPSATVREPSRLSPVPKASCLRYPYSSTLRKTKRKGRSCIWICLRRKKRAKKQHSPQDSIALLACCGAGGVPVGHGKTPPASPSLPVESGIGAPYLPSRYFQTKFNTVKTRSSCARQLQNFSGTSALDMEYQRTSGISGGFRTFGPKHLSPASMPL